MWCAEILISRVIGLRRRCLNIPLESAADPGLPDIRTIDILVIESN